MGGSQAGKALFLVGCLPLLLISGCLGSVVLLSGGALSCSPTTSVSIDESQIPDDAIGQGGWHGEQLKNAAVIINVAADMGLSVRDQTIGVMTAMGESTLEVIDHGDDAGPDSRGLFQQRDNGAWGTYEDRMDPVRSSEMFFEQLEKVEGRDDMEPTLVAHEVQRNADAYHYESYWPDAKKVVEALSGADLDPIAVNSQQCAEFGKGGEPQLSQDCQPVANQIHPSACKAYAALVAEFGDGFWDPVGGVGCQDPRNGQGDHPVGQACDYMMAPPEQVPTPAMDQRAIEIVQWIMTHHEALEVKYIIYDEHIWNPAKDAHGPWEEVKREHAKASEHGNTFAHVDHIHLSTGPWYYKNGR
ncbi:hypothetical protein [Nocardiopsis baichengensis]|uniref:hypothetical protein n=1 Tax=Nocardiopsis baichengensis TaxID=280240 RepID=UPI0003465DA5|nr:hypothetical protein [Nocardiopsis baichengensis]